MEFVVARLIELLAVALVVAILARRLSLPYTVGLVLTGLGLALLKLDVELSLVHDVIFDVILPPLLFEAALNLRWSELRPNLVPVLAISTLGVGLCAAVVAAGLIFGLSWPVGAALAFGALIAATDPIAVIAVLRENGVHGRLALLIESESLANDGFAALLFSLVLTAISAGAAPSALEVLRSFAVIGLGGLAIGGLVGFVAMAVAGRTEDHLVETGLTAVAAYGAFLAAERLGASGVLATVAAGMAMGNFGLMREGASTLSSRGREFVVGFWDFAAFLANSFVFLLIGLALGKAPAGRPLAVVAIIALALLGRAAAVYPLGLALSRSRWSIPLAQQHFLWWAGLRGALALALALSLPPDMPYRQDILVGAFGVVAFSVLAQGLTARWALKLLKLQGQ